MEYEYLRIIGMVMMGLLVVFILPVAVFVTAYSFWEKSKESTKCKKF